jgi:hypothetical protein
MDQSWVEAYIYIMLFMTVVLSKIEKDEFLQHNQGLK